MNADATLAPLDDFEMRVSSIWRSGFHTQMTFSSARNSWGQLLESSQSRKLIGITAKESEMVSVQRSLVLGADRDSWKGNSTYADLLHLLEGQVVSTLDWNQIAPFPSTRYPSHASSSHFSGRRPSSAAAFPRICDEAIADHRRCVGS